MTITYSETSQNANDKIKWPGNGPYREIKVQASPAVVDGDESFMETRTMDRALG